MSERSKLARERWRLLKTLLFADAQTQAKLLTRPSVISKRSHGQFQLFNVKHLDAPKKPTSILSEKEAQSSSAFSWLEYSVGNEKVLFEIRQTTPKLTLKDFFSEFSGFLNTGNICIWPAEEILAWYVYENQDLFKGKSICELGGGMAALAGVVAAALCSPKKVVLTEGNPQCVANLQEIIDENSPPHNTYFPQKAPQTPGEESLVTSRQILWDVKGSYQKEFDTILVADCLYAEEVHYSLLHVIKQTLHPGGKVYVMAPKRGPSFEGFKKKVEAEGSFAVEARPRYSDAVWAKHQQFLQTDPHYNEDVHYPLLMTLTWANEEPQNKKQRTE